jgi:hypothetical protein
MSRRRHFWPVPDADPPPKPPPPPLKCLACGTEGAEVLFQARRCANPACKHHDPALLYLPPLF